MRQGKKPACRREAEGSWETLWRSLGWTIHEHLLLRVARSPWVPNTLPLPVLSKAWLFSISVPKQMHAYKGMHSM